MEDLSGVHCDSTRVVHEDPSGKVRVYYTTAWVLDPKNGIINQAKVWAVLYLWPKAKTNSLLEPFSQVSNIIFPSGMSIATNNPTHAHEATLVKFIRSQKIKYMKVGSNVGKKEIGLVREERR